MSEGFEAHILNFYEDLDMPVSELYDVIDAIAACKLENVEEKMDGINVTFTVIDGELRFFSKGPSAVTVQRGGQSRGALAVKHSGNPGLRDAFLMTYDIIDMIVRKDPDNSSRLFAGGSVLVESSVIVPTVSNTVVYDTPQIRFIKAASVDKNVSVDQVAYTSFVASAKTVVDALGKRISVGSVPFLRLTKNLSPDVVKDLKTELDDVVSLAGVSRNATVGLLIESLVVKKLDFLDVTSGVARKLAHRLVSGDKQSYSMRDIISSISKSKWDAFKVIDDVATDFVAEAALPLERVIQRIGVQTFRNLDFAMASNNVADGEPTRQFVRNVRDAFNAGKIITDPARLEQVRVALERIDEEMYEKAVEGIVFVWRGKLRKLTGMFAPINRLRGFFHFGKNPAKISGA